MSDCIDVHKKPSKLRQYIAHSGVEIGLATLLLISGVILSCQHELFGRQLVLDRHSAASYRTNGYADQLDGGLSTITLAPQRLAWSCDLRPASIGRYCGYAVALDGGRAKHGLDLSNLDAVTLMLNYHGPRTTMRVFLKNNDPHYTDPKDPRTSKVNTAEFSVVDGRQIIVLHRDEFGVAGWWLVGKTISRSLQRTEFNRIVSIDINSGTSAPPGRFSIAIDSLTLSWSIVTPAQLYLMIIVAWAMLLGAYIILRMRRARRDALEMAQAEGKVRDALASAKQAAERANKAKSEFLADMSHELRTPLNGVLGFSQILEMSSLTDDQRVAVRGIYQSGEHLLSLINDSLDLSKIEAGKMELYPAPMDIRGAVATVAAMLRLRAEEKGLAFSYEVGPDVPTAVMADEQRLRQVLLNLLSNAVKFTQQGGVSLRVSCVNGSDDQATLRFEVQDTGPGIAEEGLERIFQPYAQVGDIERRKGGTGLGLTISRRFVELMGATIQVSSRLGEGAQFWFEPSFPVCEPPAILKPLRRRA